MSRKRRQVVLLLSSDDEAHEPKKAAPDKLARKKVSKIVMIVKRHPLGEDDVEGHKG